MFSAISFSLPSHSICETKQALVQVQPHVFQLVNLPDLDLDFCPDVLILDNEHYTYQGVEHGRAIYTLTEMLEKQIIDRVLDRLDEEELDILSSQENIENTLPVDYRRVIEFYECTMCRYRTVTLSGDVKTEDCIVAESQGSNPPCSICGSPTVRLLYPLERNDLVAVSRKDYGYVEKGSRVDLDPQDAGMSEKQLTDLILDRLRAESRIEVRPKSSSLHVDAHNPAYPPCPRCENLAKVLSDLLENPPGLGGIKVGSDHFGNKYVDYGWLEAIRRVRTAMVPLSCGTTTEKDQK